MAVAKRENRELEERQRLEAEQRERQRIEAERRRLLEEKRVVALEQLVGEQVEAERIGRFVEMLASSDARSPQVEALLAWARERRARQLERLSPATLEQRLTDAKLFDQDEKQDVAPLTGSAFRF